MPSEASHIEFSPKTSAFRQMVREDVKLNLDAYHRKIEYAARAKQRLANPTSSRFNILRLDLKMAAWLVAKAIIASAAANLAVAKAMLRAEEVFNAHYAKPAPAQTSRTGSFDLDR